MTSNTEPLSSNAELHGYLLQTAEHLTKLGLNGAADKVRRAAAQGAGLSTEFLGESRLALADALRAADANLQASERSQLVAVIAQLDKALQR
jgi:hypothetical protein